MGLNGHDEPIITSLPELLASSVSLTTGEPVYLEIDIPPPPVEDPDQKVLPLGEVSIIMIASPHKSAQSQKERAAWLWRSGTSYPKQYWKHLAAGPKTQLQGGLTQWSSLRLYLRSQKELLQPVDTSSQVSAEMEEASKEGSNQHLSHHHSL